MELSQEEMLKPYTGGLHPSTTHLELSNLDILNDFIHNINGEVWDESYKQGGGYRPIGKPLMNQDGISYMISLIAAATSRDKVLADLDEEYIRVMTKDLVINFIIAMRMNWEIWDMDKASFGAIRGIIEHTIYSSMTRAKNGNTMDQIAQMSRDMNIQKNAQDEKEGWISKMSPFNKP